MAQNMRTVNVTRYITPLREGGSLPAIAEADDGFLYVLKFRGAGQGPKALISELIGGEIARCLGLKVPELVYAELDAAFGRTEPDEEIQDLLKASVGLNLALHYLEGSITFDPAAWQTTAIEASKIVWLDNLLLNVDRTVKNTNMLQWKRELWLIDHGAALYFHHSWANWETLAQSPFALIKNHVFYYKAVEMDAANAYCSQRLTVSQLEGIVNLIPDSWLLHDSPFTEVEGHRLAYLQFLSQRLAYCSQFNQEALHGKR